jgi:hypothetical protein
VLISKINFKIYKKYYFNIFINRKIHKKKFTITITNTASKSTSRITKLVNYKKRSIKQFSWTSGYNKQYSNSVLFSRKCLLENSNRVVCRKTYAIFIVLFLPFRITYTKIFHVIQFYLAHRHSPYWIFRNIIIIIFFLNSINHVKQI